MPAGFLALRYGFYAAALGIIAYAGALEGFALYWIVPMFTWLVMIMRIRSIAEHHAIEIDEPEYRVPADADHCSRPCSSGFFSRRKTSTTTSSITFFRACPSIGCPSCTRS